MYSPTTRPRLFILVFVLFLTAPATLLWAQPGGGFDFLSRMDTNRNGMIDPDEAQGRMGEFIRRIAESDRRIDPRRPIPIRSLNEAIQRQREQYSQGRGDSRNDDRGRSSSPSQPAVSETLVPGFDVEEALMPPPGFGDAAELFLVEIEDRDRREAAERFERYDRDKDGKLSRREVSGGRWSDDPFFYDANHDDYLTPAELAVRYANRRLQDDDNDRDRDRDRDRRDDSRDSRSSRDDRDNSNDDENRARSTIERYDRNRDGKLSKEEADQGRWFDDPWQYDKNRDRYLTADELSARYAQRRTSGFGGYGPGGGNPGGAEEAGRPGVITASDDRASYRLTPGTERIAAEYGSLPGWFFSSDTNGDGQVSMAEYAASWSNDLAEEFLGFDANGDGIITAAECDLAENGEGDREAPSYAGRDDRDQADDAGGEGETSSTSTGEGGGGQPVSPDDVDPRYLSWATTYIKGFDKDGDGELSLEECAAMDKNPADADLDRNGRVSPAELAKSKGG